jgi:hypothetical protein
VVGLWPLIGGAPPRVWGLAISGIFLSFAVGRPTTLRPLNRLWMRFGALLHRIVNPFVLGLLFYLVITPFGLIRQLLVRDPLRLRTDPQATSYWVTREPGPPPDSMKRQF